MTTRCDGCGVAVEPLAVFPGDVCIDCYTATLPGYIGASLAVEAMRASGRTVWTARDGWLDETGTATVAAVVTIAAGALAVLTIAHGIGGAVLRMLGGVL